MENKAKYLLKVPVHAYVYGNNEALWSVPRDQHRYVTKIKTNDSGEFFYRTTSNAGIATLFSKESMQTALKIFDELKAVKVIPIL